MIDVRGGIQSLAHGEVGGEHAPCCDFLPITLC